MTMPKFAVLPHRGVVRVGGPDAQTFLQNLITADIETIDRTGAGFGALLTPQGKILFDFLIQKSGADYLLDTPTDTLADLVKRLTFYRLRAKVDIEDMSANTGVVACWGMDLSDSIPGVHAVDPRLPALGTRIIGEVQAITSMLANTGVLENRMADYHAHRISLGVPEALLDYAYSDIFPHDADMDQLGGVSFSKGCYVGQEVVSRVHHRGTARKRIIMLTGTGALGEIGTPIHAGDREIGTLCSWTQLDGHTAGLALVRLDKAGAALASGLEVTCEATPVELAIPEWATFTFPAETATTET